MKRVVYETLPTLLLLSLSVLTFNIQPVKESGTIYIRTDGSIDPPTAPIHRDGNNYTFIDNIYETIVVEIDDVVIDGNSYKLQDETAQWYGFVLDRRSGVTIKNIHITGFDWGIWLSNADGNTVSRNNITNNYNGISLTSFCNDNTIKENNITNNSVFGIYLGGDSFGNIIYHNNFIDNQYKHAYSQLQNTWDNGAEGNYWSNYTGVDADEDGIGDTPYKIEEANQDRYPLMAIIPEFPSLIVLPLFMITTILAIIMYRRKKSYVTGARCKV